MKILLYSYSFYHTLHLYFLTIGIIKKCWNHPDSEKLLCEEIDVGEENVRSVASGLRAHYKAEEMEGRKVVVVCNLKDAKMGGFKSQGMVLCACNSDHSVIKLLEAGEEAVVGERIVFKGYSGDPAAPSAMAKKKLLEKLAPGRLSKYDIINMMYCMPIHIIRIILALYVILINNVTQRV